MDYIIKYKRGRGTEELGVEAEQLVAEILKMKHNKVKIVDIFSETGKHQKIDKLLKSESGKARRHYKKLKTKPGIYRSAYQHFYKLYYEHYITEEQYKNTIEKLRKIFVKNKDLDEIKKQIVSLYIY